MVVRIFARRHLIAVRCRPNRQISTTALLQKEGADKELTASDVRLAPIPIREAKAFQPGFFSSAHQIPQSSVTDDLEGKHVDLGLDKRPKRVHPLVVQLRRELKGKNITRSIERIWALYLAIYDQHHTVSFIGSSSSHQSLPTLLPKDHQAVLRAISGVSRKSIERQKQKKILISNRYQGRFAGANNGVSDSVTEYLQRVALIFSQLRQYILDDLPSIDDYDTVLGRLAPHGNMPALTALWAHLTGSTSEDFSVKSLRKITSSSISRSLPSLHQPTSGIYLNLMLGISRHLSLQIQRIHKQHVTEGIWKGQGRKRERKEASSAKAAASGNALYGQQVSPQARRAVHLAAARTVSLLDDMLHRQITPDKMTVDLALRIFRMEGNVTGISSILRLFDVDLNNPDANPNAVQDDQREKLPMDVHTLNTIVMALGEQGTTSEMIAAYETLSKPLPSKLVVDQEAVKVDVAEGSLFAMDWKSVFSRGSETVYEQTEPASIETTPSTQTPSFDATIVMPNTTTITTMVKHCCTAPDPTRMVAGFNISGSKKSIKIQEDHQARRAGDYLGVAAYLISEAMSFQQRQSAEMARGIGLELPDIDSITEKIINWTKEYEKEAAESDTAPSKEDFISRLMEERKDLAPLLSFDPDFVPRFHATDINVNYGIIQPIIGHASRKRTSNFSTWRSIISQMQKAMAIKVAEMKVLHSAIGIWDTFRREGQYNEEKLSNETLRAFVNALRKQRKLVRDELESMASHFVEEVLKRFAALRQIRRDRQYQPILKRRLLQQQQMQDDIDLQEKKARAAKVKLLEAEQEAEMNLERAHYEADGDVNKAAVPAVEPVFK